MNQPTEPDDLADLVRLMERLTIHDRDDITSTKTLQPSNPSTANTHHDLPNPFTLPWIPFESFCIPFESLGIPPPF